MDYRLLGICLPLAVGAACGRPDGADTGVSDGGETGTDGNPNDSGTSASGDTDGTSDSAGESTSNSDTDGGNAKFDVASDEGGAASGCKKVDFLFVIDNSGSMLNEQTNLLASFGPFMDTIQQQLEAQSYHVMVVDSDACYANEMPCQPMSCEDELGAGHVHDCEIPVGDRYLSSEKMSFAEIKESFQCLGAVGVDGALAELPMSAMVDALTTHAKPNGCNEGFLRDDAILVITIITDDHPKWGSNDNSVEVGSPAQWFDAVVDAKSAVTDIVVLGLFALPDPAPQDCIIVGPPDPGRFVDFVKMFEDQGVLGSVCEDDYDPIFQQAVGLIDSACDDFVPPG